MPKRRNGLRPDRAKLQDRASVQLRKLREAIGVTQAAVAEATGMTQAALSNYESGKQLMMLDAALALARYYDLTVEELVGA